ncbi:MAG: YlxR family protein [Anaerolineae bacterium]|nr:YlxR family protein [Anaerolineae bacterium]MDQ7035401.1 YlxR family protein [Anaerolineae bacterium]
MTHRKKTVPQRMCVICRNKVEKRRLTRFVRTSNGVFADSTGKQDGRGAYVCDAAACRDRAITTDVLGKALRYVLTDADRQRIREVVAS